MIITVRLALAIRIMKAAAIRLTLITKLKPVVMIHRQAWVEFTSLSSQSQEREVPIHAVTCSHMPATDHSGGLLSR